MILLFETIRRLANLPSAARILTPTAGDTNIVPVDYVADAMVRAAPVWRPLVIAVSSEHVPIDTIGGGCEEASDVNG